MRISVHRGRGLLLLTGLCFGGTLPHFTGQSLLLLGYMVLLSAVAQTIWSALTRYNPVGRVAVYGFLNPVFGVLLSARSCGRDSRPLPRTV